MLILADKRRRGGPDPPFWADIIYVNSPLCVCAIAVNLLPGKCSDAGYIAPDLQRTQASGARILERKLLEPLTKVKVSAQEEGGVRIYGYTG